jgi:integrase
VGAEWGQQTMGVESDRAFRFTEFGIEQAIKLVRDGRAETKKNGRRVWRDAGDTHGLHIAVGHRGATFWRIAKVGGRKVETRIGDATAMRISVARDKARQLAAGVKEAAAAPIRVRTDGVTVDQAWKAYIDDATSGKFVAGRKPAGASTIKSYEELYAPHLKKTFGKKSLHNLAKHVGDIHEKLRSKPATANRLLQVIRNLFTHAAINGNWTTPNPTINAVTGRALKKYEVKPRKRYLNTAEASRVLAYAETEIDPWKDFWRLLVLTGVRSSTLRNMKWAHVDIRSESTWSIPTTKNGDPLMLPLVSMAADILRGRLAAAPKKKGEPVSDYVFPMKEDPKRCIVDLDHAWARVKEKAKLDDVRIHDLRHTAGSWATQGGTNLPAVGKMLGHRSHNSTAIYAHADIAGARAGFEIVQARLVEAGANK